MIQQRTDCSREPLPPREGGASTADQENLEAYEEFRRALVERDERAWDAIYSRYNAMVQHWVLRSGAFASSGESGDYFVNAAFVKFWQSVTPERFAAFPSVATLLSYLQRCVVSVVIDGARSHARQMAAADELETAEPAGDPSPDEEALERLAGQEFWRNISGLLRDDVERVIIFSSYVVGLKPREIFRQRRDLFGSVAEIYAVKRSVLERLKQHPEVRQWAA